MKIRMTQDQLASHVKGTLEKCAKDKKEWLEKFNKNSVHALEWSDHLFDVAAKEGVYTEVQEALQNNVTVAEIADYTYREVLNKARFTHNSTSSGSNKIQSSLLKVKAEMLSSICSLD